MENEKETFEYTYSAEQQAEIKKIRDKYLPKKEDKLEQIRKLDRSATQKGTMVGIIVGLTGCLVFGTGLSLALVVGMDMFLPSLCLGFFGIIGMAGAYPLYKKITEKERKRIAPKILALTEEIR